MKIKCLEENQKSKIHSPKEQGESGISQVAPAFVGSNPTAPADTKQKLNKTETEDAN